MGTLAETINQISTEHLRAGGLLLGQNVEAVQNVHSTVPVDEPGVTILPTSELSMAGVAIGAALSGRPVIYVLRFSSFVWLQAGALANYAAAANMLWGYNIPLFVRILAMDGGGPTHTGSMASILAHRPGLTIAAPCMPAEYKEVWNWFIEYRQPTIVCEHRSTYEWLDNFSGPFVTSDGLSIEPNATVIGISNARATAVGAAYKGLFDYFHLVWLTDLERNRYWNFALESAKRTKRVVIADCAYEPCSIAEHIAYKITCETGAAVRVVGMEPRLSGVAPSLENGTPTVEKIIETVKSIL